MIWDKRRLLVALAVARAELTRALLAIPADAFETTAVVGDWTPHDLMAHIAARERWACEAVRALRAGRPLPGTAAVGQSEAFNAQAVAHRRAWPLKQLLAEFTVARRQLIVAVAGASAQQLARAHGSRAERVTIAGLAAAAATHDREHAPQLNGWKARQAQADAVGPKLILQAALETNRSALLTCLDMLPPEARTTLAVEGTWTAQDICGHIADWDEVALRAIFAMIGNAPVCWAPGDYAQAWNQAHALARRGQAWARTWRDLIDRRGTVVTELQERIFEPDLARNLTDPWGKQVSLYRWLCLPCYHDAEHTAGLWAWFEATASQEDSHE